MAVDVAAECPVDQLEGELLGRFVGEPDDEGGGEELAQPVGVLALAGKYLVLLVESLALQLDPFFGAAEDVLEPLQGAKAELLLAEELGDALGALGNRDQADREAVVLGL